MVKNIEIIEDTLLIHFEKSTFEYSLNTLYMSVKEKEMYNQKYLKYLRNFFFRYPLEKEEFVNILKKIKINEFMTQDSYNIGLTEFLFQEITKSRKKEIKEHLKGQSYVLIPPILYILILTHLSS